MDEEGVTSAPSPRSEPAKKPTTYVLLRKMAGYDDSGPLYEEIARIEATSREAAWEEAKVRCPVVVPEEGEEEFLQLVPNRFWRQIRSYTEREVQSRIEGL